MAQLDLGQVIGEDDVSPIIEMNSTADTLTVTITDAEGTKTKTVAKGTTIYYSSNDINSTEVGTVWIK